MKNVSRIQGQATSNPGALVPKDEGANVNVATDLTGVLWVNNAGGGAVPAAGLSGAPLAFFDTPAAATAPDADTPAAGGAFRNQLNTLIATINAVNAQPMLTVTVRDGGIAGTILYAFNIGAVAAGASVEVPLTGLNITGTANTEMTVNTAAPAAGNFVSIACTGKITT